MLAQLFVNQWEYGIAGTGYALAVTYIFMIVGILVYSSLLSSVKDAWFLSGWREIQSGMKDYLKFGIPGSLILALCWLPTEILALFSGYLGVEE